MHPPGRLWAGASTKAGFPSLFSTSWPRLAPLNSSFRTTVSGQLLWSDWSFWPGAVLMALAADQGGVMWPTGKPLPFQPTDPPPSQGSSEEVQLCHCVFVFVEKRKGLEEEGCWSWGGENRENWKSLWFEKYKTLFSRADCTERSQKTGDRLGEQARRVGEAAGPLLKRIKT